MASVRDGVRGVVGRYRRYRRAGGRARSWVPDVGFATGVCAVAFASLALSDEPAVRAVDVGAYGLLAGGSALLLLRRRQPVAVLAAVAVVALMSFALGYPGGPPTVVLMAAIYAAAAAGRQAWTWSAVGLFAGVGSVYRALVEGDPLVTIALNSALFVLVALLGDAVSSRRALRGEAAARLRHAEEERERDAQRRVLDERLRIARELHDVMAHTLSTVTVQAGAAADSLDERPEAARTAVATIRGSTRQAMSELRATVSVLRDGDQRSGLAPTPGLVDLPPLIESVEHAGLTVALHVEAGERPLPAAAELTAYRLVQEALTNVVRHAGAATATVVVAREGDTLVVTIDDDGCGTAAVSQPGFGLQGMRERAEAVGGWLRAGPRAQGGFRVGADLPVGELTR
ncbi:sensor histidine kinase [Egibacter rhizosphaerae]|nr:sensor histidine kinase [Egibacter rhizosphaerae]